jgi:hypothetical protein
LAQSPRSQAKRLKPAKAPLRAPAQAAKSSAAKVSTAKIASATNKGRQSQVVLKSAKAPASQATSASSKKVGAPAAKGALTNGAALKAKPAALSQASKASGTSVKAAPPQAETAKPSPVKAAKRAAMNGAASPAPEKPKSAPSVKLSIAKPQAAPKAAAKPAAPGKATKTEPAPSAPPPKKPARKSIKEAAGVSTDAVARRTGKTWDDWFEVLDNAGAATLDQRGIIAILAQKHGIGPWWQQMIAVGYESLRAKSDKPPAPDGFQINSSCTVDAPLTKVFRLWNDSGERARWLADDRFVVRSTTGEKSIRARWGKGTSQVAVSFAEKAGRTQVSVDHLQIESRDAADQMKAYWAKKLGLLDQALAPRR